MTLADLVHALLEPAASVPAAPATPIDRALTAAAAASRVADAFLAGYQAALRALCPDLPADRSVCLCATEEGGAHPRAIATRLEAATGGHRLFGRKSWVTGGPLADLLLVVASVGSDDAGRNRLRVVRVDAHAAGVSIVPMPPTPFVPEIPHARVEFDGVAVAPDALLPGDGWDRYLKPFRTIEDIHVHGAVMAYVLGVARRHDWPRDAIERLLAILVAARSLAAADPAARETHLALAGVLDLGRRFLGDSEPLWERVGEAERERWRRDRGLLLVAENARRARTEAAWRTITPSI